MIYVVTGCFDHSAGLEMGVVMQSAERLMSASVMSASWFCQKDPHGKPHDRTNDTQPSGLKGLCPYCSYLLTATDCRAQ